MAVDRIGDGLALRSKGDIVSHDGTANVSVSTVSDGYILTARSSAAAGVAWEVLSSGSVGYNAISFSKLTTAAAEIQIDNIPSSYEKLVIHMICQGSKTTALTSDTLRLQINGHSTTADYGPYNIMYAYATSSGIGTHSTTAGGSSTYYWVTEIHADVNTSIAQYWAPVEIEINNYADTGKYKTITSSGGVSFAGPASAYLGSTPREVQEINSGTYTKTNAVSSLKFYLSEGNFKSGTWIAIYGVDF
jgi:hypothetical protein